MIKYTKLQLLSFLIATSLVGCGGSDSVTPDSVTPDSVTPDSVTPDTSKVNTEILGERIKNDNESAMDCYNPNYLVDLDKITITKPKSTSSVNIDISINDDNFYNDSIYSHQNRPWVVSISTRYQGNYFKTAHSFDIVSPVDGIFVAYTDTYSLLPINPENGFLYPFIFDNTNKSHSLVFTGNGKFNGKVVLDFTLKPNETHISNNNVVYHNFLSGLIEYEKKEKATLTFIGHEKLIVNGSEHLTCHFNMKTIKSDGEESQDDTWIDKDTGLPVAFKNIALVKFKGKQPEMITSSFKAGEVMVTDRYHEDGFGNIVIQ